MVRMWHIGLIALAAVIALVPGSAFAQGKTKAPAASDTSEDTKPIAQKKKDGTLKFNTLEIEGERETPNVIIIQEAPVPKNKIEDAAVDDLDRVFAGIRSLNLQFDKEFKQASDVTEIGDEASSKLEERRLREAQQPKPVKPSSKTSLR